MRDNLGKIAERASNRVYRAIKDLRLTGNLFNASGYEYGQEDARKIVRALQRELEVLMARFSENRPAANADFSL
jgi:hypothetical protein